MTIEDEELTTFLLELHRATGGDPGAQASMHAVGGAIGMDKQHAGKVAEELIGKGWAEVKTLSGGIGITAEGLEAARAAGGAAPAAGGAVLGKGPVLDTADRETVAALLDRIRAAVAALKPGYTALEEMVLDIKTLEVQLLSPKPKTAVVKAVLASLRAALQTSGGREAAQRIGETTGE